MEGALAQWVAAGDPTVAMASVAPSVLVGRLGVGMVEARVMKGVEGMQEAAVEVTVGRRNCSQRFGKHYCPTSLQSWGCHHSGHSQMRRLMLRRLSPKRRLFSAEGDQFLLTSWFPGCYA